MFQRQVNDEKTGNKALTRQHQEEDKSTSHIDSSSWSEARWWRAVFAGFSRPVAHHLAVDGAAHTIVQLCVQLRQSVRCAAENKPNDVSTKLPETPEYCITSTTLTCI